MNEIYNSPDLSRTDYTVSRDEENVLKTELAKRTDTEASRIRQYIDMPDLSRTETSPLYEIKERVTSLPILKKFDHIDIPEIISTEILFDLFDFAPDHVARSKSDTYYVNDTHVLRTHDTVMWHYYLNLPEIKQKVSEGKPLGVMCYGKVYRKDEIDRRHMNIFHQMGGLFLQPDSLGIMPLDELKNILTEIVQNTFGKDVKYQFLDDTFPYTDPSLQIEVEINGNWVEIMGGGMPKKSVLKKLGLEGYNGWAFGFGLERLAMIGMELPDIRLLWSTDERVKRQLKLGTKFVEVSKYPPIVRDISFIVPDTFIPNDFFDLARDIAGSMMEEMALVDTYKNDAKFGEGNVSYAFRITYRSLDRTLTNAEIDTLHKKLEEETKKVFSATIR
ncbi:MAG: tRNA ligase subunit PheS family protein [Minisyncoccota bacterium]